LSVMVEVHLGWVSWCDLGDTSQKFRDVLELL
jgi:hypothetical protein